MGLFFGNGGIIEAFTNPASWWDKFKNGNNSENVAQTNAANVQMTADTNAANLEIAQRNIDLQRETNAQNEALMREQWAREDNAYTRTAEDMRNAGINVLAMNGTNGAGQVVGQTAPQNTATMQAPQVQAYQEATSDFQVLGSIVSSLQNLAAQDEVNRHNRAVEQGLSTKYEDIKNVIKEGAKDFAGAWANVRANSTLGKTIDALEEKVANAAEKAAEILEDPKKFVLDKTINKKSDPNNVATDRELKQHSKRVEEYRKKQKEEKEKAQKKAYKDYYLNEYLPWKW